MHRVYKTPKCHENIKNLYIFAISLSAFKYKYISRPNCSMFCINTFTFASSLLWHCFMPEHCWNHWRAWVRLSPRGTVHGLLGRIRLSRAAAAQGLCTCCLGMLCAEEATGMDPLFWSDYPAPPLDPSPSYISFLHSIRSLQSILGFSDSISSVVVQEVHEHPSIHSFLGDTWSTHDCRAYDLGPPFHLSSCSPFSDLKYLHFPSSSLLVSCLYTVCLTDPTLPCICVSVLPGSKRGVEGGAVRNGVKDCHKPEHSVKGYGQKTWDNVSQWSVHPSINLSCPSSSSNHTTSRTNRLRI